MAAARYRIWYDSCMGKNTEKVITIDPATASMGYAVWSVDKRQRTGKLESSGTVVGRHSKKKDGDDAWLLNSDAQVAAVLEIVWEMRISKCVIEMPQAFHSERSYAAMGSIIKLAAFVGALRMALNDKDVEVMLATVGKWKGTTPKNVTMQRIRKWWNWQGKDHNEGDAVGIGDWYIRKHLKYSAVK